MIVRRADRTHVDAANAPNDPHQTDEERATLPPPPPPPTKKSKGGPDSENVQSDIYNPSFLEYIIEMEHLGASFYLDDKKITTEKAKSVAKNNKGKSTEMITQKDKNGQYVVKLSSPHQNTIQEGATKQQVAVYNKLARYYNKMLSDGGSIQIQMKDVERLKYIYGLMSDEQRKNAQPFPDFPEPPPPPPAPEMPEPKIKALKEVKPPAPPKPVKVVAGYKVNEKKTLTAEEKARMKKKEAEAYKAKREQELKKLKTVEGKMVKADKAASPKGVIAVVPPPPPPPSPLDYVIEMAKTNAKFYYESKEISSDKAIEILKKNPELNVRAKKTDTRQPLVYISKKPIVIEVKSESRN